MGIKPEMQEGLEQVFYEYKEGLNNEEQQKASVKVPGEVLQSNLVHDSTYCKGSC